MDGNINPGQAADLDSIQLFPNRGQCVGAYHSRPGLWDWVVVCVPLLSLSVDFAVSPIKCFFHLVHSEGAHCRAFRPAFVPLTETMI